MQKEFNITGICRPAKHYMADISAKLEATLRMVEKGNYFIINRPRQYGKTTMLFSLENVLMQKGEYLVFNISFEGIGDAIFEDEKVFSPAFLRQLADQALPFDVALAHFIQEKASEVSSIENLSRGITQIVEKIGKKVVLLIDEVDKSSNNQLFVSFLAMLRNKYLVQEKIKTFHSVVLAGVHDVKTLKLKIRTDDEQKLNSPWNIASDYKVDLNLQAAEIVPMIEAYSQDRGLKIDAAFIAERLFYYTSGYPFLVSKLCKMLDEDNWSGKPATAWSAHGLETAVQQLVREGNSNFDSLVKNLENNPELYDLVYQTAIETEGISFNIHHPIINQAVLYGVVTEKNGKIAIHNPLYNEIISNYMISKMEVQQSKDGIKHGNDYRNNQGGLNLEAVMLGFQTFMKKEYSKKDRNFLERQGRLVFLAFLKPIINGSGYDFKEPQISEERRLDVVITYLQYKYVAEMKIWRGSAAHEKGLLQLVDYLDRQQLNEGYLLIFDHAETKNWRSEWRSIAGKKVFVVWV
jgi:hypothetical protein